MALQDHIFSGGFECWYRGMRFSISSAGTNSCGVLVLLGCSPYKMAPHLSIQQRLFISKAIGELKVMWKPRGDSP